MWVLQIKGCSYLSDFAFDNYDSSLLSYHGFLTGQSFAKNTQYLMYRKYRFEFGMFCCSASSKTIQNFCAIGQNIDENGSITSFQHAHP
jgi:hypothetical protein